MLTATNGGYFWYAIVYCLLKSGTVLDFDNTFFATLGPEAVFAAALAAGDKAGVMKNYTDYSSAIDALAVPSF